jgi:hypothetical protein
MAGCSARCWSTCARGQMRHRSSGWRTSRLRSAQRLGGLGWSRFGGRSKGLADEGLAELGTSGEWVAALAHLWNGSRTEHTSTRYKLVARRSPTEAERAAEDAARPKREPFDAARFVARLGLGGVKR